ncbi:metal ABC transporter permease [Roseobacteraceae bacterium S113]
MTFLDDFLVRAALAGLGVAIAAAPLGCFVVWRRMAYFGDATAHAAILGVALSLALSVNIFVGVVAVALVMGLTVAQLAERGMGLDTGLGVIAHAALALGLVAVTLTDGSRIDLMSYLFGDILAVSRTDLAIIWCGAGLVLMLMYWRWNSMLMATLSPELATASGLDPRRDSLVLTVSLAIVVAVAIKVVGVLLIGAMLLIPAAAARAFASTPERMAVIAGLIGGGSALAGLELAAQFDTPAGPTVVCCAAGIFVLSRISAGLGLARGA